MKMLVMKFPGTRVTINSSSVVSIYLDASTNEYKTINQH